MNRPPDHVPPFIHRPWWRFGFLAVIIGLYVMAFGTVRRYPEMLGPASLNIVVASILLVNHVVASFLTPVQQIRVRPWHFGFLAVCVLYVGVYIAGGLNQWF